MYDEQCKTIPIISNAFRFIRLYRLHITKGLHYLPRLLEVYHGCFAKYPNQLSIKETFSSLSYHTPEAGLI